ncbi:hypothetical protein MXB_1277, partial [Myxobolus squamalis]
MDFDLEDQLSKIFVEDFDYFQFYVHKKLYDNCCLDQDGISFIQIIKNSSINSQCLVFSSILPFVSDANYIKIIEHLVSLSSDFIKKNDFQILTKILTLDFNKNLEECLFLQNLLFYILYDEDQLDSIKSVIPSCFNLTISVLIHQINNCLNNFKNLSKISQLLDQLEEIF